LKVDIQFTASLLDVQHLKGLVSVKIGWQARLLCLWVQERSQGWAQAPPIEMLF